MLSLEQLENFHRDRIACRPIGSQRVRNMERLNIPRIKVPRHCVLGSERSNNAIQAVRDRLPLSCGVALDQLLGAGIRQLSYSNAGVDLGPMHEQLSLQGGTTF